MERSSLIQKIKNSYNINSIIFKESATSCFDFLLSKYQFEKGAEIIVPVSLCISMIKVIKKHNLVPIFADIDGNFFINISQDLFTDKTKMILFVNQYGYISNLNNSTYYNTLGEKIICVLDNAQCMLCNYDKNYDAIIYSFNKNKPITVDGGLGLMALSKKGQDFIGEVKKEQLIELESKLKNFSILKKNKLVQEICNSIVIKNRKIDINNNSYYRLVLKLENFGRKSFGRFENALYKKQCEYNLKIVQTTIDVAPFQNQVIKKYLKKMGKPLCYQKQFPVYNKMASSALYFIINENLSMDYYNTITTFINDYKNISINKI